MTRPLRARDIDAIRQDENMAKLRFPGAPEGSWVSDEGWLIIGDEAWTEEEWWRYSNNRRPKDPAKNREAQRRWVAAHLDEKRRLERERQRRRRAA